MNDTMQVIIIDVDYEKPAIIQWEGNEQVLVWSQEEETPSSEIVTKHYKRIVKCPKRLCNGEILLLTVDYDHQCYSYTYLVKPA
jgi:hypothetical protein